MARLVALLLARHDVTVEPQPWDHVVLGEDEHPLEKACDVRGFPTVLLVGPDGTVVNRDEGLWANLERIVPNHLPKENAPGLRGAEHPR